MMEGLADAVIDRRVLGYAEIAGLVLGILGSLYLTYDLLGRQRGPLRWLLRFTLPTLLGGVVLGVIGTLEYFVLYRYVTREVPADLLMAAALQRGAIYALIGAMIGAFNGLFVQDPASQVRPGVVSAAGAVVGAAAAYFMGAAVILVLNGPLSLAVSEGAILAPAGILTGAVWRFANYEKALVAQRSWFLSRRGAVIGFISAGTLAFVSAFLLDITTRSDVGRSLFAAVLAAALCGPAGALTGSASRLAYWWANTLPPRALGALGVMLTLVGFAVQLVQPLVVVLGIAVR